MTVPADTASTTVYACDEESTMMKRSNGKSSMARGLFFVFGLYLAGAVSLWGTGREAAGFPEPDSIATPGQEAREPGERSRAGDEAGAAGQAQIVGEIKGRILDYETRKPLAGASVAITGLDRRTSSDAQGNYAIRDVPFGYYVLSFELDGYYAETRTDIIVRSGRTTFLNMDMLAIRMIRKEVSVTADYFSPAPDKPVSRVQFNAEELRRDPGSGGDLSRALYSVPGIVKADEEANDLIIRGGSPTENGFYVDNIFFPNINHFPQQGASGGNICMLNMDFIESLEISTGGFDASYGNRLSSIIDVRFREGNRERFNGQANLSVIGYGAQLEGPIAGGKGSWMFSGNRSYLDLISKVLDMGTPSDFFDLQGKVAYDLGRSDRLSVLAVGGSSRTDYEYDGGEKFGYATAGLTWRHLWGGKGYSDTSLSTSFIDGREREYWPWAGILHEQYDYRNTWSTFRNVNRLSLSTSLRLIFGAEAQRVGLRNRDDYDEVTRRLSGTSASAFITAIVYPFSNFSLSPGLRVDYLPFSERINISPRFSFDWSLTRRLSVNGAFGIYYQQMPLFLIQQEPGNARLRDPRARHLVLGVKYLLRPDAQVTLEAYDKAYSDFPMAPGWPYGFVIDVVNGDHDRFWDFEPLINAGKAYARGVEFTLQKKLSKKLYGFVNFTYYRSRYRDLMGTWRNRLFDNRFIFGLSGGYKFSRNWEVSARWIRSGNRAFSPVNEAKSIEHGIAWIEFDDIMAGHLSDYENLSVRVERRLQFKGSNLVAYLGFWNLFNHENELYRLWDPLSNAYMSGEMWGTIPFIGLEFEF